MPPRLHSNGDARQMLMLTRVSARDTATLPFLSATACQIPWKILHLNLHRNRNRMQREDELAQVQQPQNYRAGRSSRRSTTMHCADRRTTGRSPEIDLPMSLRLSAATARFASYCLPAFAQNERDYEQSRNGISPRDVPNCINCQSHQRDERKISTQCRLCGVGPQRSTSCGC